MSIIACPRCRDEVTLPPKVSPQARVRCPLCRDEYILSEALAAMPPALIVLDRGADADVSGYAEPEYKVAGESGASPLAPADVFGTTGPTGEGVSPAPRQGVKPGRPRKRKEGSAIGMMVQVVLGGVGALVLFQAMAWWTPMDRDPFGLGPEVAKIAPMIVPEKFRGASKPKANQNGAENQNTNVTPPKVNNNKRNGSGGTSNAGGLDTVDPTAALNPPNTNPKPVIDPNEIAIDDPLNPKPKPATTVPDKPVDFTPPMEKPIDPNLKTPAKTLDIKAKYFEAMLKRDAFEQSTADDAATRQAKGREMYEAAAELGKLCTDADWTDPENEESAGKIKEFATALKPRIAMLTFLADERLNNEAGKDSIVVAGVIKGLKPLGATHETTIEIARRDGSLFTVPIVTTQSLESEGAKEGDTLMVFGRIIREPKKDLPKYKGEAPLVVQSGATTVLPAE